MIRLSTSSLTLDHIRHELFGIPTDIKELQPALQRRPIFCFLPEQTLIAVHNEVAKVWMGRDSDSVAV